MKKIILGVSSSISAYKACDLTRMFVHAGLDVHVVMTENATELVAPLTFETLSGNPVYTDTFVKIQRKMGHISLKDGADLLLVVPATANCLAKFAHGLADDLLSTTYLSVDCPVMVAPAMNPNMWQNKAVQRNVEILEKDGIIMITPACGDVVCGDSGTGRLAEISEIFNEVEKFFEKK